MKSARKIQQQKRHNQIKKSRRTNNTGYSRLSKEEHEVGNYKKRNEK